MDIVLVIVLMVVLSNAMDRHGTWKGCNGFGDYIGFGIACLFLLAFVRLPIYLLVLGWHFPFNASFNLQLISGIIAIAFWWAMAYWRVPGRVWRACCRRRVPKNMYPQMPRIDPPSL